MPPPKQTIYNLHTREHDLTLFVLPSEYMCKNVFYRMLHTDIY